MQGGCGLNGADGPDQTQRVLQNQTSQRARQDLDHIRLDLSSSFACLLGLSFFLVMHTHWGHAMGPKSRMNDPSRAGSGLACLAFWLDVEWGQSSTNVGMGNRRRHQHRLDSRGRSKQVAVASVVDSKSPCCRRRRANSSFSTGVA